MKACPACERTWSDEHEVCPRCLAALVADLNATITCRSCGHVCPVRMQSCPSCFALLRVEDIDPSHALAHAIASGIPLRRPPGVPPFAAGPGGSVRRLSPRGPLVVCGIDGFIEAAVDGQSIAARPPVVCTVDGELRFRLEAYGAADDAVVAVAPDGVAMGTFLRTGVVERRVDIRDETSAPVARLQPAHDGGYEVIETGGGVVASGARTEIEWEEWTDDEWSITPITRLPLADDAVIALVVASKLLLGKARPTRREPREPTDDEDLRL